MTVRNANSPTSDVVFVGGLDVRFTSWRVLVTLRVWLNDYHDCNAFRVWQVIVVAKKKYKNREKSFSRESKMASLYVCLCRPSQLRASDLIWLLRLIISKDCLRIIVFTVKMLSIMFVNCVKLRTNSNRYN